MGLTDTFTYDGVDSSDFGFYASGEATFDTPEKEYEVYEIPGRNGDLEVFNGRFKNITVTYPCVYQKLGNDFAGDMAQFRAALLSRHGYCRLYDSHHPEYYRMGICKSALTTNPTEYDLVSTLNVEFDCKPQRFLTSGEVPVTIASGDAITNPTLFESHPLLMVDGYGDIQIGGNSISVVNSLLGKRKIADKVTERGYNTITSGGVVTGLRCTAVSVFDDTVMTTGDKIWFNGTDKSKFSLTETVEGITSSGVQWNENTLPVKPRLVNTNTQGLVLYLEYNDPRGASFFFRYGTSSTVSNVYTVDIGYSGSTTILTATVTAAYDGAHTVTVSVLIEGNASDLAVVTPQYVQIPELWARTTLSTLGQPLYIDLEDGMAYKYVDGEYVSVNGSVWLGAELPTLKPGINTISYTSTVTSLQVVPRWWTI